MIVRPENSDSILTFMDEEEARRVAAKWCLAEGRRVCTYLISPDSGRWIIDMDFNYITARDYLYGDGLTYVDKVRFGGAQ